MVGLKLALLVPDRWWMFLQPSLQQSTSDRVLHGIDIDVGPRKRYLPANTFYETGVGMHKTH